MLVSTLKGKREIKRTYSSAKREMAEEATRATRRDKEITIANKQVQIEG